MTNSFLCLLVAAVVVVAVGWEVGNPEARQIDVVDWWWFVIVVRHLRVVQWVAVGVLV